MLELHPNAHSIREAHTVVLGWLELVRLGVPIDIDEICRAVYVLCAPHIRKARSSDVTGDLSRVSRALVPREVEEPSGSFVDHASGI